MSVPKEYKMLNSDNKYMDKSVSLREYVLRSTVAHMRPERLPNNGSSDLSKFNSLLELNKSEYEYFARNNVVFDEETYKYITPRSARDIVQMYTVKDDILASYLNHFELPHEMEFELTASERTQLIEMLYKAYVSHKFDKIPFHDVVKDIELTQVIEYVDKSGVKVQKTISQYIEDSMKTDSMIIADIITNSTLKHREYWINNVPGFLNVLMSTDLDDVKIDEDDVIEKVNLSVLMKIKSQMGELNMTKPREEYIKTVIRVFQELIAEVAGVNVGRGDEKLYLTIDDVGCRLVLEMMFKSCQGIYAMNEKQPAFLQKWLNAFTDFENVKSDIFWEYFMKLHIFYGSELGTVIRSGWRDDPAIRKKIVEVARNVSYMRKVSSNSSELSSDQLLRLAIVKSSNIVVYTKEGCGHCQNAKKTLAENEISYKEKRIRTMADIEDEDLKKELDVAKHETVPIIVVDGEFIGGNDVLQSAMSAPQIRPNVPK